VTAESIKREGAKDAKQDLGMGFGESTSAEVEAIAHDAVDAAFRVHQKLGPGVLESAYEACLAHELRKQGYQVETQVVLPILYDGIRLDAGYRIDIWVNRLLIIEVKAVDKMNPVFEAQVLTYLKFSENELALLINFNVTLIKEGIRRIIRSRRP
jgi:GxxExxY protein